jgi:hypothetical protein
MFNLKSCVLLTFFFFKSHKAKFKVMVIVSREIMQIITFLCFIIIIIILNGNWNFH